MNILVLGAGGMAGHMVALYLSEHGHDVDTLSAHTKLDDQTKLVDVHDTSKLQNAVTAKHYDAVINCIGLLVKESEDRQDEAIYINSFLPKFLEQLLQESDTQLIHLTTNGVFSGKKPPYTETSVPDGVTFYGRTKALGEIENQKDLTLRLSIIGPELKKDGKSLFNWFYGQHGKISGYSDSLWNGVTTLELAKVIDQVLERRISGICNLAPKQSISKYELLLLFKAAFQRDDITITPTTGSTPAATIVSTRRDFDPPLPDYDTMVKEMKDWIEKHQELYPQYEK